jgi:hypothetical protein
MKAFPWTESFPGVSVSPCWRICFSLPVCAILPENNKREKPLAQEAQESPHWDPDKLSASPVKPPGLPFDPVFPHRGESIDCASVQKHF